MHPSLFDVKPVYSYVVEVADSESDLDLHGNALVSETLAFELFTQMIILANLGCTNLFSVTPAFRPNNSLFLRSRGH